MMLRIIFFNFGDTFLRPGRNRIVQTLLDGEGFYFSLRQIRDVHHTADAGWEEIHGGRVLSDDEEERVFKELNFFVLEKLGLTADNTLREQLDTIVGKRWSEVEKKIKPELYPEVQPYLQKVKERGFTLGLISNAAPKDREIVSRVGLDRYIDHVVISGIVGFAKPDPVIFRYALNLASVLPDESLHVGNSYKADVLGARSAGMNAVLIDRDERHNEADCPRIRRLDDLEILLT